MAQQKLVLPTFGFRENELDELTRQLSRQGIRVTFNVVTLPHKDPVLAHVRALPVLDHADVQGVQDYALYVPADFSLGDRSLMITEIVIGPLSLGELRDHFACRFIFQARFQAFCGERSVPYRKLTNLVDKGDWKGVAVALKGVTEEFRTHLATCRACQHAYRERLSNP